MTVKIVETNKGHVYMQWIFAILANVPMFSYGLQCGWISSVTPVLQSLDTPTDTPLSGSEISLLASSPSLAAVFSVSVFGILADRIGRRSCIVFLGTLQVISWTIRLCTANMICLIISQMCCGIAGGGCFNLIPMYVKEISEPKTRGILGVLLIVAQNLGILVMYSLGGSLNYYTAIWTVSWIPLVSSIIMCKAPESPAFLVKIGKLNDAASTIAFLRGVDVQDKNVQNEIDSIKSEDEKFKSIPSVSFVGIFKQKAWRRGFIYMILVMIGHGLNGAFSIVTYASIILMKSGVTIRPELLSLCIPTIMLASTFLSMTCVERLGRRAILAATFGLSVISFCCLSAILIVQLQGGVVAQWLPILAILLVVSAYASGVAPMPFVIMAEMFNFQIRGKIMGCLVTTGWLSSFVQLLTFEPITTNFGAHVSFLVFAIINLFGLVVVLVLLPETKGKSVEEIEDNLERIPLRK